MFRLKVYDVACSRPSACVPMFMCVFSLPLPASGSDIADFQRRSNADAEVRLHKCVVLYTALLVRTFPRTSVPDI